ncbi:hypothetical protein OAN307_c15290 [Octadecabacter antarcticus 307]|uniref:PilZ domain-containing protein n=1 Tax=Octadecabacter antarcticus 307 TaxID=391626 RepID=M9R4R1_9RHOB|nr:PilZ domain-containing protein [Octadecabacter antarcticus]AGI67202.1 hypothetical protein OAN307_c15290 [Octadecabacter antarcticus 307]
MTFRARRYATNYPIAIRHGATEHKCVVSNISETGACVVGMNDIALDEQVEFIHNGNRTPAKVRWIRIGKIGLVFDYNLSARALDQIRYSLRKSTRARPPQRATFTELL